MTGREYEDLRRYGEEGWQVIQGELLRNSRDVVWAGKVGAG